MEALLKSYLNIYLKYNPSYGSQYGFCKYDSVLENPTSSNLMKEIDEYIDWIENNISYKNTNEYKIIRSKIKKRIYELVIWNKPFTDPNYYFNIIYNSIFWIVERNKEKNVTGHRGFRKRFTKFPELLKTMITNLKQVSNIHVKVWNKNIDTINDFPIDSKYKKKLMKLLNSYTKRLVKLPDRSYFLGYDNLKKIFDNNEMMDIDLHGIYKQALEEHKELSKLFTKELDKVDGKTIIDKINNYDNKYHLTEQNFTQFIEKTFSNFNGFVKDEKILDISFLKNKLFISPSFLLNMTINETHMCNSHKKKLETENNNHITLYVEPLKPPYNYVAQINTLVHEYIHYIQYESDRVRNNKYSLFLHSISTGEGVAHFFEEYIYKKGFMDGIYKISLYHNMIYFMAKFMIGYEIHVNKLSYNDAVNRFKVLSMYDDNEAATRTVDELTSDVYTMEYYIGKVLINKFIAKNKNFDINNLIKRGSLPLKFILY